MQVGFCFEQEQSIGLRPILFGTKVADCKCHQWAIHRDLSCPKTG